MIDKKWLSALKPMVSSKSQWIAFTEVLDAYIEMHSKKLEQSGDLIEMYRSQGAVYSLRKLKQLKDETDGSK
jgi:tRNA splicing ligase